MNIIENIYLVLKKIKQIGFLLKNYSTLKVVILLLKINQNIGKTV